MQGTSFHMLSPKRSLLDQLIETSDLSSSNMFTTFAGSIIQWQALPTEEELDQISEQITGNLLLDFVND